MVDEFNVWNAYFQGLDTVPDLKDMAGCALLKGID